jgi:hypothetical protein
MSSQLSLKTKYQLIGHLQESAVAKRGGKSMDALYKTLERLRELLRACVERSHHPTE